MTPNEIEALVEAKVRVVLAQLLGPLITQQPQPQAEWLDLKDAFAVLGFPSQKALRDAIRDGLLRQGMRFAIGASPARRTPAIR